MTDEQTHETPAVVPAEPTPAPVAKEQPKHTFNAERNERTAEFLARTPEAEMDLLNKLAERPGSVIHSVIIDSAQQKALRKFGLGDADLPLLGTESADAVMRNAEALRKRYDEIKAAPPAAPAAEAPAVPTPFTPLPTYKPATTTGDGVVDAANAIAAQYRK